MMHRSQEDEVKLEMIQAIVRSQSALARMLEHLADVTEHAEGSVKGIKEDIRLLSNYQLALCGMITGWRSRHKTTGTPATPWFNPAYFDRAVLDPRSTGG